METKRLAMVTDRLRIEWRLGGWRWRGLRLRERRVDMRRVEALMLPVLLAGAGWLQFPAVLHHDPAWLIHGTEVFLHGGALYRDVFELNPPLIFYLTVPPVWVAGLLHLFDVNVFVAYVFLLIAVSLGIVRAVLHDDASMSAPTRAGILLAAGAALAIYPASNFGQREHLLLIFCLPYLFLIARRAAGAASGVWLGIAVGAFAAPGFALKPHFLLVPFAAECFVAIRLGGVRSCIRAETMTLAAGVALYFAAIVWFTPAYLTVIVPIALKVYNRAYEAPLAVVLGRSSWRELLAVLSLHLVLRRHQRSPETGDILGISAVCFFVVYLVQMKGWSYQSYPLRATLFLLLAVALLHGVAAAVGRPRLMGMLYAAAGLVLVSMAAANSLHRYSNRFMTNMAPLVADLPAGSSIYVFTAKVSDGFPLVNYYGVGWASRFDTFWLLPGIVPSTPATADIERFLRDAVADDLSENRPVLVFVDDAPTAAYFPNTDFDYIEYFSADPRFAAIWAGYEEIARIDKFRVFRRRSQSDG